MIKKHELIEGAYYIGTCRNTNIAQWFNGKFIFINFEFNRPYIETVDYYGDVKNLSFDGFIPIEKINININQVVDARTAQDYKNGARKIYLNLKKTDMKDEVWKSIPEYEGLYYASNMGRIKKRGYPDNNKIMKQSFSREYLVLGLTAYGQRKTYRVHRLVAMTFKKNKNPNYEVNHINGIKTDNREINLEWIEHSENSKHMYTSGNVCKKLTPDTVIKIKKMLNDGCVQKEIAKRYNVSPSTISEINTNKKWKNIKIMKDT